MSFVVAGSHITEVYAENTDPARSLESYRLHPIPSSLERVRHVHPRIFIDTKRIAMLQQAIKTTHASLWEETKRQADRAVKEGPPEYRGNGDGEGRWGFEQLWQRNVGNAMSSLAMAWVLTGDSRYLDSAREWAIASCGYKTWGGLGWADGIDLAASHQLFGLGLIYDWCYNDLDAETKETIRETLVRRTSKMVGTVVSDKIWWNRADIRDRIWYRWQNAYLQNHLWVNMCGVTVAGLALFDEVDEAAIWIGLAQDKFSHTMAALGDDGASHEGVQWLAVKVDEALPDSPRLRWLNLIWYNPAIPMKSPTDLPTLRHFTDMGIVSARSDWSGDESLVVFKCGPYIGHKAVREQPYDAASAHHVHPDSNHFILFGCGEFLIRDDGYHAKWTDQHNTLMIDGNGQLGEGGLWFDGSKLHEQAHQPRIVRAISTPELDHMTGDATAAYPETLGLKRFIRQILFVKPDAVIVADDIIVDSPRELELRFHPERHTAVRENDTFMVQGRKSLLRLDSLTPVGVTINAEEMNADNDNGGLDPMLTVRLRKHGEHWRNAVGLSWSGLNDKPPEIVLHDNGDTWTFTINQRTVTLNWSTGQAVIHK